MYFEIKHHGPHLKRIIDDQHARLGDAQQKLSRVEEKQPKLEDRIDRAIQQHGILKERLQRLRNLPGAHKKPLSRAEREFKCELGMIAIFVINAVERFSFDIIRENGGIYSNEFDSNVPCFRSILSI